MISLTKLMNSLQIQEQRRLLREELLREKLNTKGVFLARSQSIYKAKKKGWKNEKKSDEDNDDEKEKYSACQHYKKTNHPHWKCWWRPDVVCRSCNGKGHMGYAKESNKRCKLLKRLMMRKRSFFLWRLVYLVTSLVKHG